MAEQNQPNIPKPLVTSQLTEEKPQEVTNNQKNQTKKSLDLTRYWYVFLIIGILLVVSIIYFWFSNQKLYQQEQKNTKFNSTSLSPKPTKGENETVNKLKKQSNSDEVAAIENDLSATDLNNLDQEIGQINQELSKP